MNTKRLTKVGEYTILLHGTVKAESSLACDRCRKSIKAGEEVFKLRRDTRTIREKYLYGGTVKLISCKCLREDYASEFEGF